MVEGQGDEAAAPGLVHRLIELNSGLDTLFVGHSLRVGEVSKIVKDDGKSFFKHLEYTREFSDLGAVLLLLDGDAENNPFDPEREEAFCTKETARTLAKMAQEHARAGDVFSFAVVFAIKEFESWILAGHPDFYTQMGGKNVEDSPRDAKRRIKELKGGYQETLDQAPMVRKIELEPLLTREPRVRSFVRLDHAVRELIEAVRTGKHISTPCPIV